MNYAELSENYSYTIGTLTLFHNTLLRFFFLELHKAPNIYSLVLGAARISI